MDGVNEEHIEKTLVREKDYFDNILAEIDPKIRLDDEQRRAVVTDDDYCLLVGGAGAVKPQQWRQVILMKTNVQI